MNVVLIETDRLIVCFEVLHRYDRVIQEFQPMRLDFKHQSETLTERKTIDQGMGDDYLSILQESVGRNVDPCAVVVAPINDHTAPRRADDKGDGRRDVFPQLKS